MSKTPKKHSQTSRTERTNVEFPLWRKKVDNTIFREGGTTIPKWACKMWDFNELFPDLMKKSDPASSITILFERKNYKGWLTSSWPNNRADKVHRLWWTDDLRVRLKETFLMSYMRDIEGRLYEERTDVESEIPFWEFLDIEFDSLSRTFKFVSHYRQKPTFPELFKRLTYSPALKRIDDELKGTTEFRIYKQDWRPRKDYETEIGAENVIYMLADTKKKLLYIGEAENLVTRFNNGHPSIKDWELYRYDQLPPLKKKERVALERMMIRAFASTLSNKRDIPSLELSNYSLVNEKIDG
jgi:hypothetical protein